MKAAVFAIVAILLLILFVTGLRRGESFMGIWLIADRKAEPILFWIGQTLIGLFAVAAVIASIGSLKPGP
jgi:hypothetical protein